MATKNDITELSKGVFQFGPISKPQKNGNLRIFVHPYDSDGCYETKLEKYPAERDRLIRSEKIPQILLVDKRDLSSVLRRYEKPPFPSYRSIFLTETGSPEPLNGSWEDLKDFIRKKVEPKKLLISGAILSLFYGKGNTPPEMIGCVGYTCSQLKEFNPEVQTESCLVVKFGV